MAVKAPAYICSDCIIGLGDRSFASNVNNRRQATDSKPGLRYIRPNVSWLALKPRRKTWGNGVTGGVEKTLGRKKASLHSAPAGFSARSGDRSLFYIYNDACWKSILIHKINVEFAIHELRNFIHFPCLGYMYIGIIVWIIINSVYFFCLHFNNYSK